jgi:hypothetical protein
MPCWLLGVWLYRHPNVRNMKQGVAITLFVGSILCYLTVFWVDLAVTLRTNMDAMLPWPMSQIGASRRFIGDYVIALLITVNFASVVSVPKISSLVIKVKSPISLAASFTLSIYLYHIPLLSLFRGGFECPALMTLIMIAAGIIVLGLVTEHKRTALRNLMTVGLPIMGIRSKATISHRTPSMLASSASTSHRSSTDHKGTLWTQQ